MSQRCNKHTQLHLEFAFGVRCNSTNTFRRCEISDIFSPPRSAATLYRSEASGFFIWPRYPIPTRRIVRGRSKPVYILMYSSYLWRNKVHLAFTSEYPFVVADPVTSKMSVCVHLFESANRISLIVCCLLWETFQTRHEEVNAMHTKFNLIAEMPINCELWT